MTNLERLGRFGGRISALILASPYAYAVFGPELTVIDLHDPAHPVRVGWLELENLVVAVVSGDKHLFVSHITATGEGLLSIVDVSEPALPAITNTIKLPQSANSMAINKKHLFLTGRDPGLLVYDISNPVAPRLAASFTQIANAGRIVIQNNTAYVNTARGLYVLDVADPSHIQLQGHYNRSHAGMLDATSAYVCLITTDVGLLILDFSDPSQPALRASYGDCGIENPDFVEDLVCHGHRLCMISEGEQYEGTLVLLDISEPAQPRRVGTVVLPGERVALDNKLIVGGFCTGLRVYDRSLTLLGQLPIPMMVSAVVVSGSRAYIAGGDALYIVDVTTPAAVTCLSYFADAEMRQLHSLDLVGEIADVVEGPPAKDDIADDGCGGGLRILDLALPDQPVELSFTELNDTPLPGLPNDVLCVDTTVYILWHGIDYYTPDHHKFSILVFDVTDKTGPIQIGTYPVPDNATTLDIQDQRLLVSRTTLTLEEPRPFLKLVGEGAQGVYQGVLYRIEKDLEGLSFYRQT